MATPKPIPVFLLHGWTKDVSRWKKFVSHLKKKGYQPKLLKIPGLTTKLDKPWHLNNYVEWFDSQTQKHPHFHVIAHSFGGRIAIKYDITHPNRIKKLILIDSAGIRPAHLAAVVKRASFKAMAKIGKKITKQHAARKFLYKLAGEKDYYQADRVLAQTMTNVIEQDLRQDLQFVKAHTLIVWGRDDKTTPLSDGRTINKAIMGSSFKIIDEAGHSPHYTHPDQVAGLIDTFLAAKN